MSPGVVAMIDKPTDVWSYVGIQDRLDNPSSVGGLAKAILELPSEVFPVIVRPDYDEKKKVIIERGDWSRLGEILSKTAFHDDRGFDRGGFELEPKRKKNLIVMAGWLHPRPFGLNCVHGGFSAEPCVERAKFASLVEAWVIGICTAPVSVVCARAQSNPEQTSKLESRLTRTDGGLARGVIAKKPPEAITDIVWLNVFGKPYVDLIGRDKLLSCPCYKVEELSNGAIVIQVSETPYDFGTQEYSEMCDKIKRQIGLQYFFDWDNPDKECPMPKLDIEYVKPREYTEKELEEIRIRAGIPAPANPLDPDQQEWLTGLQEWVDNNPQHAEDFVNRVGKLGPRLNYTIDSLKILDKYILEERKKEGDADVNMILDASAYLAQVLIRNSTPAGRARLRVSIEQNNAIIDLPNGLMAIPTAHIANLWNQGKDEGAYFYARAMLSVRFDGKG